MALLHRQPTTAREIRMKKVVAKIRVGGKATTNEIATVALALKAGKIRGHRTTINPKDPIPTERSTSRSQIRDFHPLRMSLASILFARSGDDSQREVTKTRLVKFGTTTHITCRMTRETRKRTL